MTGNLSRVTRARERKQRQLETNGHEGLKKWTVFPQKRHKFCYFLFWWKNHFFDFIALNPSLTIRYQNFSKIYNTSGSEFTPDRSTSCCNAIFFCFYNWRWKHHYVKKKWLTDALAKLWRNSHQNQEMSPSSLFYLFQFTGIWNQ